MLAAFEAAQGHLAARACWAPCARARSRAARRGRSIPQVCWSCARSSWPIVDLRVDWSEQRSGRRARARSWTSTRRKSTTTCAARSIPAPRPASACPAIRESRRHEIHFPATDLFHRGSRDRQHHRWHRSAPISPSRRSRRRSRTSNANSTCSCSCATTRRVCRLTPAGRALLARCETVVEAGGWPVFGRGRHQPPDARRVVGRLVLDARADRHAGTRAVPFSKRFPEARIRSSRKPSGRPGEQACERPRSRWRSPTICRSARTSISCRWRPCRRTRCSARRTRWRASAAVKLSQLAPAADGAARHADEPRIFFGALLPASGSSPISRGPPHSSTWCGPWSRTGSGYTLANVRPRADVALDGRRLYRVPLSGDPPPVRIGIATLKQLKKTRLVEAFERHCQELISEHYIPGHGGPRAPPAASGADERLRAGRA